MKLNSFRLFSLAWDAARFNLRRTLSWLGIILLFTVGSLYGVYWGSQANNMSRLSRAWEGLFKSETTHKNSPPTAKPKPKRKPKSYPPLITEQMRKRVAQFRRERERARLKKMALEPYQLSLEFEQRWLREKMYKSGLDPKRLEILAVRTGIAEPKLAKKYDFREKLKEELIYSIDGLPPPQPEWMPPLPPKEPSAWERELKETLREVYHDLAKILRRLKP